MADQLDPNAIREINELLKYHRDDLAAANSSTKNFTEGMTEAAKAEYEAAEIIKQANRRMEKAQNEAIRGMASFGKALTSGAEGGFNKFGDSLNSAAGAVSTLTSGMGILGKLFGGLVIAGTKVFTMQMKQADDALKASDDIKKLGNAGALSTKQVMEMVHGAGLSADQAKKLTDAMKRAGSGVIGLGDKFGDGAKAFGDMVAVTKEQRAAFQRLGINQEELMGYQGDYLALQKASGMQMSKQAKDGTALRDASLAYTRNLVELSIISGNDLETTQKNIKAEKERYEYVLYNTMQQREMDRATASGNTERAEQIKQEIEARDKLIKSTSQYLSESDRAGLAMYLTTGAYTEASAKFATAGVDMEGFRKRVQAGDASAADFAQAMKDATGRQVDQLGTAALFNTSLRESTLLNKENLQTLNARNGIDEKDMAAAAKKAAAEGGASAIDPAELKRNFVTNAIIDTTVLFDEGLQATNVLLNGFDDKLSLVTASLAALAMVTGTLLVGKAIGGVAGKLTKGVTGMFGSRAVTSAAGGATTAATKAATTAAETAAKPGFLMSATEKIAAKATSTAASGAGTAGIAVGEAALKTAGVTAGKSLLKSLPLIGSLLSAYSAFEKIKSGDYIGAALEGGAAIAALFPGPGTAISLALSSASGARDVYNALNPDLAKVPTSVKPETSKTVSAPVAPNIPSVGGGGGGRYGGGTPAKNNTGGGGAGGAPTKNNTDGGPTPVGPESGKKLADLLDFKGPSGTESNFKGLNQSLQDKVLAAAADFNSTTGGRLQVNSANRSHEDQERLYKETEDAKRPGIGPTGMPVAKPGRSRHESGKAIDIQNYQNDKARTALNSQGLYQTIMPKDPVHFEQARNGGVFNGSTGGYPVTLHGREAVVPMPDPSSKIKVEKDELSSVTTNNSNSVSESTSNTMMNNMFADIMEMMANKLDLVIDKLANSNDTQSKILMHSRV